MRFIRGSSFADAIYAYHNNTADSEERKLQFRELLKRFIDVCDAIGYAHSRGVLYRDLKPAVSPYRARAAVLLLERH
jgi:eukaryotic-like serine/threonine-protein kinase